MRGLGNLHGSDVSIKPKRNTTRKLSASRRSNSSVSVRNNPNGDLGENDKKCETGTEKIHGNVTSALTICTWDMHQTDSTVYLPVSKSGTTYIFSDIPFCSWECTLAYSVEKCRNVRYEWLYELSGNDSLKRANHPSIIDSFGGFMDIETYRKHDNGYKREFNVEEISTTSTFYSTCKDDEETVPSFKRKPFTSSYASDEIAKKLKVAQPVKKRSFLERSMGVKREQL